jgi:DNA-binding winged helix-turn-helix (wHTH) protein
MDRVDRAKQLHEDFLAGAHRYPRLRHFLVWGPPGLAGDLYRSVSKWVAWGHTAEAGAQLVEAHLFQFRGSRSDAKEAEAEFADCALDAWRWAATLPDGVRVELPHGHDYAEYLNWVDLLYLTGLKNRIRTVGVEMSYGYHVGVPGESPGGDADPVLGLDWQRRLVRKTLAQESMSPAGLWEQSLICSCPKRGSRIYLLPRARFEDNLWSVSAAAIGHWAGLAVPLPQVSPLLQEAQPTPKEAKNAHGAPVLRLKKGTEEVWYRGQRLDLGERRESCFVFLSALAGTPGGTVQREKLVKALTLSEKVTPDTMLPVYETRNALQKAFRKAGIDKPQFAELIETDTGIGYRLKLSGEAILVEE